MAQWRMWAKALKSGCIPDCEMTILVPLCRQRLPSPAFPLSPSLVSGIREDLMLVQCPVKLAQPTQQFWGHLDRGLLFKAEKTENCTRTQICSKIKKINFSIILKTPTLLLYPTKIPQSLVLFALKWHMLGNTALMVESDLKQAD